jgi:hypothetical protein
VSKLKELTEYFDSVVDGTADLKPASEEKADGGSEKVKDEL